ncbi:hypothetical protein TNCV_3145621 [Trichonephila clavipes]|nr:hypothetical protein TNCV_3145621 [Trichonephila clavipes]
MDKKRDCSVQVESGVCKNDVPFVKKEWRMCRAIGLIEPRIRRSLRKNSWFEEIPCTRDTAHKTFGPSDLTSTYSVCTWKVLGGIGHRTQAFRSGVRCSNH